jgi:hypothetical protein
MTGEKMALIRFAKLTGFTACTLLLSTSFAVSDLQWSSFRGKEITPSASDKNETCPDGIFKFRENKKKDHFVLEIGSRHSFEWRLKPTVELESHTEDCSLKYETSGSATKYEMKTTRSGCAAKDVDGYTIEKLEIKSNQEINFERKLYNNQNQKVSHIDCRLSAK